MISQPARYDPPSLPPVGCTIRVTDDGTVTLQRDPGCAPNDVRDLCEAVASGELEIIDLTEPAVRSD